MYDELLNVIILQPVKSIIKYSLVATSVSTNVHPVNIALSINKIKIM